MSRRFINVGLALLLGVALTVPTFAQGVQTATLSGQEEELQQSFRSLALAMGLAIFLV